MYMYTYIIRDWRLVHEFMGDKTERPIIIQ